jgi:hypothetical protein
VLGFASKPNTKINVCIDWVDFVKFNNVLYLSNNTLKTIPSKLIEKELGETNFNVSANVDSTNYTTKNGDAAFLPKGTKLYKLKNYNTKFMIVAKNIDGYIVYVTDSNDDAKTGKDLMDINQKVVSIAIKSETDGKTILGIIQNKNKVNNLVKMILSAKVNQRANNHNGARCFIDFKLKDNINITRCFWLDSGELSRGIILPKAFGLEVTNQIKLYKSQ